jgi:sulfate adenylyltransferase subunit 1 (EFTu-like GTPase family)
VIYGDQHPPLTARNLSGELFWLGTNALKANDAITINCATQSMDGRIKNIENLKDPSTMQAVKDPRPALHTHELARVSFTLKDPLVFERTGAQSALGRFTITQGGRLQGLGVFN